MATEIEAIIILEIMGRPPEYLKDTLQKLIERIEKEKGVIVVTKKISEVKEIENNFFSAFAEIELSLESINQLINVIFTYMPSHVEIIKPAELKMNNFEFNSLSNDIVRRLHYYDEIVKNTLLQKRALENQLKDLGSKPTIQDDVKKKAKKKKKI